MPKAIYRPEHAAFIALLRARRIKAGLTQAQCSTALGRPQSFMSDIERGIRRLDIVQMLDLCDVLGCDFVELMKDFYASVKSAHPETQS
ncbi:MULTISPECIES: helix-turn-helix domain-containing protein [Pseudomonas putida group]|uniref:helix-turn-helix domain-containing protein n=1 Tax=Pseudomonas putida group TaxID=136845 RepID=UPI000281F7BC|nr:MULTISPECIES: helix-turn-helix transcriptional regulator [Pseudomonas putida group]EMR46727.1 putative regulatory protein [Pseudomonas putida LS46]